MSFWFGYKLDLLINCVIKKLKIQQKSAKKWSNYTKLLSILNLSKQMIETKVSTKILIWPNIPFYNLATQILQNINLDENTTTILLQYIGNAQIEQNYRIMAAIQVKNTVKRAFGNHSYTNYDG